MGISQAVAHRVLMSQPSSLIQTSCLIDDQRDTVQIVCDNLRVHTPKNGALHGMACLRLPN